MEDDGEEKPVNALAECQEVVEHLKEENAQLRESSETFADLAERLNAHKFRDAEASGESTKPGESRSPTPPK